MEHIHFTSQLFQRKNVEPQTGDGEFEPCIYCCCQAICIRFEIRSTMVALSVIAFTLWRFKIQLKQ